jgi:hypothetical protein
MLELGYKITMLDEKSFAEIMETTVFTRDEAQIIIDVVRDIPGMFPMVIYGTYENENN